MHVTEVIGQAGEDQQAIENRDPRPGCLNLRREPLPIGLQIQDLILEASEDLALPMFSIK